MSEEAPLQVARCTKIIAGEDGENDASAANAPGGMGMNSSNAAGNKYVINVKQIAKFVVGLGEKVAPTDIEEGMRVGVDRTKYSIQIPLPPKIDPTVSLMTVEDKPDVTYEDVGGAKDAMEKLREVLETPLLHPERFVALGIDPPKGILLYGPPGTGKTLSARAVANRTDACFIRVIGSELVQKYSVKERVWYVNFSPWPDQRELVSSFLMRLMLLEEREEEVMTTEMITKSKELCCKL